MDREIAYWVAFSCIPGIGRVRLGQLESHFGSLKDAWNAGYAGFRQAGLDEATCRAIEHWRPRIDPEEKIAEMSRLGIQALIVKD
ncbi:MAG: hypothetical protein N2506_06615, partial [Dehalococcoidales bacterium]|nr:hypothetical protein [Dehalococcoidales bacterium]